MIEGQNPALATPNDPDGWTDTYYCRECCSDEDATDVPEVEFTPMMPVAEHERLMAEARTVTDEMVERAAEALRSLPAFSTVHEEARAALTAALTLGTEQED